jgi:hypothetical protein
MSSILVDYIQPIQNIIAAVIATFIAYKFNKSKISLDRESFKRDLFLKYNDRYDKLNNHLEELCFKEFEIQRDHQLGEGQSLEDIYYILFHDEPTEPPAYIKSIYDYINLCAEEYYWYKKDLIDEEVWQCWHKGMNYWYQNSFFVKKIIDREKDREAAYYNFDFLDRFKT